MVDEGPCGNSCMLSKVNADCVPDVEGIDSAENATAAYCMGNLALTSGCCDYRHYNSADV